MHERHHIWQFVCTVRPENAESKQMQFTVGGDRNNYPGKVAAPTEEMLVAKMLFNSVIFMKSAHFMTMDISKNLPHDTFASL
jgi:hypothetical protein